MLSGSDSGASAGRISKVDSAMQVILDAARALTLPPIETLPVDEGRQTVEAQGRVWNEALVAGVTHSDHWLEAEGRTLRVRLYQPDGAVAQRALVFLHGGGWTFGSIDTHDHLVRRLARDAQTVVASLDYRRAPEHPAPASVHDTLALVDALRAGRFGIDPAGLKIALAGDSSGANIALGSLIAMRDSGRPLPFAALLFYGCYAPEFDTWSHRSLGGGEWMLSTARMRWYWANHLGGKLGDDPLAAPLYADLTGLPPLYLTAAGLDPLVEDSIGLARQCARHGVPTTLDLVPGVVHGFLRFAPRLPLAEQAIARAAKALSMLGGHTSP